MPRAHRRTYRHPVLAAHHGDDRTTGQRAADAIARRAGSWAFIVVFLGLLRLWMLYNGGRRSGHFDPYPYILLNLCLSPGGDPGPDHPHEPEPGRREAERARRGGLRGEPAGRGREPRARAAHGG